MSETWLQDSISDNEIKLDNHVLYRADRGTRGGGVATYVSSNLFSELVTPTEPPLNPECIFVKLTLHKKEAFNHRKYL